MNITKFLFFAKSRNIFSNLNKKMNNKILFFSAKVSVIVITALAFISCGGTGGSGGAGGSGSGGSTSAPTTDLNVAFNTTNDSGAIEFQAVITNNGRATADIALIELHRNEVIVATNDQEINLQSQKTFPYLITDTPAEPGNYSYKICVKDANNNNFCSSESSFALFPELSISLQASTGVSSPRADFYLIAEVTNDGTRFSPPTQIDFYGSISRAFDTSSNIRTTNIEDLSTDESVSSRAAWQESRVGNYFYRACVRSVLGEQNPANNCTSMIEVEISGEADVSIDEIKISSTDIRVGETITISARVKNIGLADATATTIQFYRSIDNTINDADILLSSSPVSALIAEASMDVKAETISKLERFYYGVCVEQVSLEQNISNNCSHGIFVNSQLIWQQATDSADWSVRSNHTSLFYNSRMWVLGGFDGNYKNDVWYSANGINWEQATGSATWSDRWGHTSLVYNNKMWVLGGFDSNFKNDVWYSTDGINWEQATASANWSARNRHTSLVYDNKMWVLGGGGVNYKNDVWHSIDGINWEQATGSAAWLARNRHTSLVYNNKMWVIGGYDDSRKNDVWYSTDGINWEQATGVATSFGRWGHTSLVYDNKMWILGGYDGNNKNDIWYSTDGINWEQATGFATWSARNSYTSLVYDNKMWVLGGYDGSYKNDVWSTFIQDSTDRGIELGIGEKVNSYLTADEKEYYSLQLSAGSYQITTEGSTDTSCNLYNTSSNELLTSNNHSGIGENCSFSYTASATEDVYLRVQGASSSITGGYALTILPIVPDVNIRFLADIGNIYAGVDFQITAGIQNIGISTADSVTIKYYFTSNNQVSSTDTPSFTSNITNLQDGAIEFNTSNNIRINSVGNYYYGVCLETANELNLTNNCLFQPVTVQSRPDIMVSVLAPDTIYLDNITEELNLQITLTNQGGLSEPFILNYFKSSTEITSPERSNLISSSDIAATNHFTRNGEIFYRIQAMAAGATRDANTNITVRSGDEGVFYYGVCIGDVRGEETTADNCASQRVAIVKRVDTSITNFQINSSTTAEEVQLTARVQNHSPFIAYNTTIRYFRSSDAFITTGDVEIGRMVIDLAGNTTENIVLDFILGNDSHHYGACINNNDNTPDNNCSTAVLVGGIGSFWRQATGSAGWSNRASHTSLVFDNKMWVLGGDIFGPRSNEVWHSADGVNWVQATGSAGWSARNGHTSLVYDNKMWVLGGFDGSNVKNDVWYSTDGINWVQATGNADWLARNGHTSLVYDNKMWVIGGYDGNRKNDVWYSTDGINWEQTTGSANWSSRWNHTSLVYDNKMWVIGGYDGSYKNDVWYSTNGINWEQATGNAAWASRNNHTSLVYDNKMWVLGGYDGLRKNDVWYSTNGINWEQATGSASWPIRRSHTSLVYDNKMWVLGGYDDLRKNDVWFTFIQDSTDRGIELGLGEKVNSYLTAGEKEYYSLRLLAGSYQITTEGSTDTLCRLYNTSSNELLANNDNGGNGDNCSFSYTASASEDVSLLVQGADSSITGGYTLTILPIVPDVSVRSLDTGNVYEGVNLQITANIQNNGLSTADNIAIKYYFPQNSQINPIADTPDYTSNITDLRAGAVGTNTSSNTSVSSSGSYYYGVCLETANELNIANNCQFQTLIVQPKPDIAASVSGPNVLFLDSLTIDLNLQTTFTNQGGDSDAILFRFYKSSDAITMPDSSNLISSSDISSANQLVKNGETFYRIQGIANGTNRVATANITVRSTGTFYYGVCVEDVRGEIATADNCASQEVIVNGNVNANITQFQTNKTRVAAGGKVQLIASIQNNSVSPENNIIIDYFRSSDNIITTGDVKVGSNLLTTLAANTTQDVSLDIALRDRGYYGACVSNSISSNNCSSVIFIETIGDTWQQATGSAAWSRRRGHSSLVYSNKMWIIGGYDGNFKNDVWDSTNGINWSQATGNAAWSGRSRHSSLVHDNKIWVLGGLGNGNVEYNDVWYSTDGINWSQATASANWLTRYSHTSLVYDDKMWVLGGRYITNNRNDVWYSTDGVNWSQATGSANWSARYSHTSLVYNNKMWVLGGDDSSEKNDVWYSTDGINWEQATESANWSDRRFFTSLVYDNRMWVLGGYDTPIKNDVWHSTNGINWSQATDSANWSARGFSPSLVYDDKMWLLGGDFNFNYKNDVWYSTASNNTIGDALALSLTSSGNDYSSDAVVANLQAGTEKYYSFQLIAGNYIIETSSDIGTSCSLYNSGRVVITTNTNSSTNECSLAHTATTTTDFYLQVKGNTASTTGIYQLLIRNFPRATLQIVHATNDGGTIEFRASITNNVNSPLEVVLAELHRNQVIIATSDQQLLINQSFIFATTDTPVEPGNYNYKICMQDSNNNSFCSNERSFALFPELSISLTTSTEFVNVNSDFHLTAEVMNNGSRFSPSTYIDVFSSLSDTFDTSSNISTSSIGDLSTDESTSYRATWQEASAGSYFYRACVRSVLGERNINNNCSNAIEVEILDRADLSIDSIEVSSTDVEAGTPLTISAGIISKGFDASATTIHFYRSTDSTISTADVLLASVPVAAFSTGASMDVRETVISELGGYYYGVCVERVNASENISNNCSYGIFINAGLLWQQATASAGWSGRNFHTSLVYDNKMWVLGGNDGSRKNDVWDSTNGINWRQVTGSAGWSARWGHTSLVYDNKMWVIGGNDGSRKNDVWYSTDGINWEQATGASAWSARINHTSLVFDNKMWVLGGENTSYKNDIWYSTDGINWKQATGAAAWSARSNHTSLVYDNKMWVIGGNDGPHKNDIWYSTDGINWVQATDSADWSGRRNFTSLVYDNKMWVLGGLTSNMRYNDIWYSTNGINWEQATANSIWSSRWSHTSLVYDNKMWVLGGNGAARKNDVWFTFIQDSTNNGIELALGEKVNSLLAADEKEYYSLQLLAGRYQITTEGSTDTLCRLYNTNNELLASNNNGGSGENCSFIFSTNTSEDVYLLVQGANSGITGNYSLTIVPIVPDINIRSLDIGTLGTNVFYEGEHLQITAQIQNIGVSTADNVTIKYYFPQNSQINPTADTPDYIFNITSLEAGVIVTNISNDISVNNGDYYYGVCLETANELNLTNNCAFKFQTVTFQPKPDIVVNVSVPNIVYLDGPTTTFKLAMTFRNQGGTSEPIVFNYYRSSTAITIPDSSNLISNSDIRARSEQFSKNGAIFYRIRGIASNTTYNDATTDITVRSRGVFHYGVCIENVQGEDNTADNCASQRVVVINRADANNSRLNSSITQFKTDKNRIAGGEEVIFTTSVQNNSVSPENNILINYFRSSDNIITTEDIGIGSDFLFTLAANTTQDISLNFTLRERGYYGACVSGSISVNNCSNAIFIEVIGRTWQRAVGNADWSVRESHTSLVYDNKMWVIGGNDGNRKNDVWYSIDGINWVQATASAAWSGRDDHTSLVYDNKMWVIGGYSSNYKNDVWHSTNGINWVQATGAAGWSSRDSHTSLVYDNKMWVLGGWDGFNHINDVWDSTNGVNWRQVTASAGWSARSRHNSLVYDNKMWVLGGSNFYRLNDVWYSTDGSNWEQAIANADWGRREFFTSLVYDNKMWVLGGTPGGSHFRDVWYSTDRRNWVETTSSAGWSVRDSHTSLVYDNKMWVLGGGDHSNRYNDVWYSVVNNDTIGTAINLSLTSSGNDYSSDAVVANLQAGTENYYSFQFTAGNYIIETSSDIGTSCSLYNSGRVVITTNTNSSTDECLLTHTATADTDFYLQVKGNTANTTGIYQLLIRKNITSIGRTSIRVAAGTILRGPRQSGQKSALNAEFQPQVQGRLEVQDPITKEHGTVCSDSFGIQDAIVACRELGFSDGYVIPAAQIEDGTGAILLDDLHCIGAEESLLDCQHNGLKVHNCSHSEDIGIACY